MKHKKVELVKERGRWSAKSKRDAVLRLLREPEGAALSVEEHQAVQGSVAQALRPLQRYRCAACGFEAQQYFWQCPGCQGWETFPPRRLEDH